MTTVNERCQCGHCGDDAGPMYLHARCHPDAPPWDRPTTAPRRGWGVELARIEAVIRHDAEVLQMFRAATTRRRGGQVGTNSDNVTIQPGRGNSRAYTLDRLKREAPALYQQVLDGNVLHGGGDAGA